MPLWTGRTFLYVGPAGTLTCAFIVLGYGKILS
jgi:hypothetical protein